VTAVNGSLGQAASAQADLEQSFPQLQEEKLRIQTGTELIEIYYAAGHLDKAAGVAGILRQLAAVHFHQRQLLRCVLELQFDAAFVP
jgi:hypothetical protein